MRLVRSNYLIVVISCLFVISCSDSSINEPDTEDIQTIQKDEINGVVQKGPFISGSNVLLFELNASNLFQTGKSFNTQIENNRGEFRINNIELSAPYASFRADGFYFNEILGRQSSAQISLQAIADVSDESGVNVNVLSHLEKPRIEYLVSEGVDFGEAKKQAQSEVLSIFHIADDPATASEKRTITSAKPGDATLLAVSSILQGYRSEADLSELMAAITGDLQENGELNDPATGSKLINHVIYLQPESIRKHLEQRYSDLGSEVEIPDFEHHIERFIQQTPFEITERLIDYPAEGRHGVNILDPNRSSYTTSNMNRNFISMAADLVEGTSLRVRISTLEGTPLSTHGMWVYDVMSPINWEVMQYNYSEHTQEYVALESGKKSDLKIWFEPGRFLVEYFEMDIEAEEPAWSREFEVRYE